MLKKSKKPGKLTLVAEILNITKQGIWLFINDKEFFLPFAEYPWFLKATIDQIYNLRFYRGKYLHWPSLDVDIALESLQNPQAYPLVSK